MPKTEGQDFSPAQIQTIGEMFRTLIAEMKKPAEPTPTEKAKTESDRAYRLDIAKQELQIIQNRKNDQAVCSHRHHNHRSAMVPIETCASINGNYLLCQHCRLKLKPAPGPLDEPAMNYVYDAQLYWEHIQAQGGTTF